MLTMVTIGTLTIEIAALVILLWCARDIRVFRQRAEYAARAASDAADRAKAARESVLAKRAESVSAGSAVTTPPTPTRSAASRALAGQIVPPRGRSWTKIPSGGGLRVLHTCARMKDDPWYTDPDHCGACWLDQRCDHECDEAHTFGAGCALGRQAAGCIENRARRRADRCEDASCARCWLRVE